MRLAFRVRQKAGHLKFARSKVENDAVLLPRPRRALGDARAGSFLRVLEVARHMTGDSDLGQGPAGS